MRRRQEQQVDARLLQFLDRERLERIAAVAAQGGKSFGQILTARSGFAFHQQRLLEGGMTQQDPRQLKTGIAGRTQHRRFQLRRHQANIPSIRRANWCAVLLSCEITRIVSSPASVPTTSGQSSASIAAATG